MFVNPLEDSKTGLCRMRITTTTGRFGGVKVAFTQIEGEKFTMTGR